MSWMLASKGKKVLMVDADPQCNLTELVLGQMNSVIFMREIQNKT
jgi:chromosome partitioning protein